MKAKSMSLKAARKFDERRGSTSLMSDEKIVARIFDHIDNGTTDRGQSSWKEGQEFAKSGVVEDREVVLSAQRGLKSGANEFLEFGLFESAIGRFHNNLTEELEKIAP